MKSTLFGVAYYDEYMPYDRIDTDFQLMKDAGMNVIRIAESTWSTWEPAEGRFDFTHLHRMLDAARRFDINVIIGTPTYAIPSWLSNKFPDIIATTQNGKGIYGHRQIHDITNPDFLYYAERIIRKLMEETAHHPQVIGFQIDNETRSGDGYSLANQKKFVDYLKEKFTAIQEFNKEFGLSYWSNSITTWEDMPDIRGTINGSLSAEYKAWLRKQISDYQMWQAEIINQYKRPDQFITHNYDFSWIGYSHGIQPLVDQNDASRAVDIVGVDIYHLSQDKFDGATISFGGAVGRSMKKDNYLVLETQSQGRLDWLPYPGQLRQAYYSHLASGANGVMYWNWHSIHNSFETYWKGILSHSLIPGEAYNELSETRKEELPLDSRLINFTRKCQAAILVDNRSLVGLDEFTIDDVSDETFHYQDCEYQKPDYNTILRWMYDTCYRMNLDADILYKDDIIHTAPEELVRQYPMLLVPALYSASEELIIKLKAYVTNGGHLLITFKSFFSDDYLKVYSGAAPHMMTDIIGGTYDQFTRPVDTNVIIDGTSYNAYHWMELLNPESDDLDNNRSEIWGNYDHKYWGKYAAILHKENNGGSATYLGCFIEEEGLRIIINKIMKKAKVPSHNLSFPVIIKEGTNSLNEKLIYCFNYSDKSVSFNLSNTSSTTYEDILSKTKYHSGERLELEPWGVRILSVL